MLAALVTACALASCDGGGGRQRAPGVSELGADTSSAQRWRAAPPPLERSGGVPPAPIARRPGVEGQGLEVVAESDTPDTRAAAESLPVPHGFKPPMLRSRPRPATVARSGIVELDLWVGERGNVERVTWAGGDRDSALVDAAVACARGSSFYPALRDGKPVAAASRQRFEFPPRSR